MYFQLKHLAFGSAKHRTNSTGEPQKPRGKQNGQSGATEEQWNEWMKADKNVCSYFYKMVTLCVIDLNA